MLIMQLMSTIFIGTAESLYLDRPYYEGILHTVLFKNLYVNIILKLRSWTDMAMVCMCKV